tara:strand:- start:2399 stop:4942 length:2544 start_codon:yes stop_codon:yes gene_type:complete
VSKIQNRKDNTSNSNPLNLIHLAILVLYGLIAVITPNIKSFDSNGPKFLSFAILNVIVWIYLCYKERKDFSIFKNIFKSKIGLSYSLLLILTAFSFLQTINLAESIIAFSKIVTTFSATWIISILVLKDKRLIKYVAYILVGLLIFDSIRVFHETFLFIKGDLKNIGAIKAGYANKNILAASLFIKIPFALWLFTYEKKQLKIIGLLAIILGVTSIFFMSARAFYLGLILISIGYISFLIYRFINLKSKAILKDITYYSASLLISFIIFTTVQSNFYPKSESGNSSSFTGRISTIGETVSNNQGRLNYWKWTAELIKEHPLTGVGVGNWKLKILEKENPTKMDFLFFFKVHNDFLETTVETGIIGGLSYFLIFVFIILLFFRALLRKKSDETIKYFFLPAFGILAYSFDAFFNFPHDRSEIQTLFAIYVGIAIALTIEFSVKKEEKQILKNSSNTYLIPLITIGLFLISSTTYALFLNYKSLRIQYQAQYEKVNKKETTTADEYLNAFPKIPNLDAKSDPIDNFIAWKYNKEGQFNKTVKLLTSSNPSPFNSRREFYLSYAYSKLNNIDSALYYITIAQKLKPKYFHYTRNMAVFLKELNRGDESIEVIENYLKNNKQVKDAYEFGAAICNELGNKEKASQIMDSANFYFPNDKKIENLKNQYSLEPTVVNYQNALKLFNSGKYKEAIPNFIFAETFYKKSGGFKSFPKFLNFWGRSHLEINEIEEAKIAFNRVIIEDPKNYYALMNLGNIAFHNEKNYSDAVAYFSKCLESNNPELYLIYKNLGSCYLVQNNIDKAIENYENALKNTSTKDKDIIGNLYLLWKSKGEKSKTAYYKAELEKLKKKKH